jgi:hypothetical protein
MAALSDPYEPDQAAKPERCRYNSPPRRPARQQKGESDE